MSRSLGSAARTAPGFPGSSRTPVRTFPPIANSRPDGGRSTHVGAHEQCVSVRPVCWDSEPLPALRGTALGKVPNLEGRRILRTRRRPVRITGAEATCFRFGQAADPELALAAGGLRPYVWFRRTRTNAEAHERHQSLEVVEGWVRASCPFRCVTDDARRAIHRIQIQRHPVWKPFPPVILAPSAPVPARAPP